MKIVVSGATGHIGFPVASLFARSGHEVLGLIRSEKRAAKLMRAEIKPLIGDIRQLRQLSSEISSCEVFIHCAADFGPDSSLIDREATHAALDCALSTGLPRLFIYTAGTWDYGNTGSVCASETSALNPIPLARDRVELEKKILAANSVNLRTLIIRPGCVYGGGGSLTAYWFESATKDGAALVHGSGANRWAMIHRDDLADMYLKAAESPLANHVFNASDRSRFSVMDCARAASFAAGQHGRVVHMPEEKVRETMGAFADGLLLDQHIDSSKAVRLLGWQPRHAGFADGAQRYYLSWQAERDA